jgi:nucleotide sugar dehydrogenase
MSELTLGVIGLGKVGRPLLKVLADHYPVRGYDILERARVQTQKEVTSALVVNSLAQMAWCDVLFIVTPTPENPGGGFDRSIIETVLNSLEIETKARLGQPTVVIVSTLFPGDSVALKALYSGELVYNPAFIRQGTVEDDFRHPNFVLFGTADGTLPGVVAEIHRQIIDKPIHIIAATFINAELGKLMLNLNLSARVALANTAAWICEQLPGADARYVQAIVGADPRIGFAYMTAGAPFGGPCLPRDVRALDALTYKVFHIEEIEPGQSLPGMIGESNEVWKHCIYSKAKALQNVLDPIRSVGIYGIGYKPNTAVYDEGLGLFLLERWRGIAPYWTDPWVPKIKKFKDQRVSLSDLLTRCNIIVWTYPVEPDESLLGTFADHVVLDVWGVFPPAFVNVLSLYVKIGTGPHE